MPTVPAHYVKGLGIPLNGSKRKFAFDIVRTIHRRHPQAKYFYDLLGGGAAVTCAALQFGYKIYYNELQEGIFNLFTFLAKGNKIPDFWFEWVSRDQFKQCRYGTTPYCAMVASAWSFGNNWLDYAFGREYEEIKYYLHNVVLHRDPAALEKANAMLGIDLSMPEGDTLHDRRLKLVAQMENKTSYRFLQECQNLERIVQMERLEQISNTGDLQSEMGAFIGFSNVSYKDVQIETPPEETVIYLDPPYRGTRKYNSGNFDNDELADWFKSCKYPCYMSEYAADAECVWEKQRRVRMQRPVCGLPIVTEKLFWNGVE